MVAMIPDVHYNELPSIGSLLKLAGVHRVGALFDASVASSTPPGPYGNYSAGWKNLVPGGGDLQNGGGVSETLTDYHFRFSAQTAPPNAMLTPTERLWINSTNKGTLSSANASALGAVPSMFAWISMARMGPAVLATSFCVQGLLAAADNMVWWRLRLTEEGLGGATGVIMSFVYGNNGITVAFDPFIVDTAAPMFVGASFNEDGSLSVTANGHLPVEAQDGFPAAFRNFGGQSLMFGDPVSWGFPSVDVYSAAVLSENDGTAISPARMLEIYQATRSLYGV